MSEVDDQQDKRNDLVWKIFLWALAALNGLVLYQQRSNTLKVDDVSGRIIAIESNRCTALDCAGIRYSVSNLEQTIAHLPKESPPKWFLDKVNRLESKIDVLERRKWENQGSEYQGSKTLKQET